MAVEINQISELEQIEKKFKEFSEKDPFPEIQPSLLNSADIQDYVEKTGMIYPFYKTNLKPASYGIKLKGEYTYWDSPNNKVSGKLEALTDKDEDGDIVFILKRNSIAYLQLEPDFRFPNYIAARFNLKIKHIYQGILLGTGPLVDPGYEGKIYTPLHNLTNNDYKIKISKPLIWMEFTKLSSNKLWDSTYQKSDGRVGEYHPFNKDHLNRKKTLSEYINDAYPNSPILSTISGFFDDTRKSLNEIEGRMALSEKAVKDSTDEANKATRAFNRFIVFSIIAIFVALSITVFQAINIHSKTIDYLKQYDTRQNEVYEKLINQESGVIDLKKQLFDLNEIVKSQKAEIEKLKKSK